MAYEQKNGTGSIFKNSKRTNDKQPGYRGSATIEGCEFWISCWLKQSQAGQKFFSLSFQPKNADQPAAAGNGGTGNAPNDDDIPF